MKSEKMPLWWAISGEEALRYLHVDASMGLSPSQVSENRARYGANTVELARPAGILSLLSDSLRQPMILLLLAIAGLSLLFGKYLEATVMAFVVLAYVAVEFLNKFRADRVMTGLKKLTAPTTRVLRNGLVTEIPGEDVVVGDVLILSPGFSIPADARLIEAGGLLVNEAALTGEAQPVPKDAGFVLPADTLLSDRINCVYAGTTVFDGEGKAVVTAVGKRTVTGQIASALQGTVREKTVLQRTMASLAKTLAILAIAVSLIIPAVGFLRGLDFQQMILTWLALTFLMIPGQPPIIIQMSLALASFRLAGKKVAVKRLQGAEALGTVTAVLTDKTGTLTENRLKLEHIVLQDGAERPPQNVPSEVRETLALSLPQYPRDPTDLALAEAFPEEARAARAPAGFEGFSRGRPWRTISYRSDGKYLHVLAGSSEELIARSGLSGAEKSRLRSIADEQASLGKRVTAIATCASASPEVSQIDPLQFVALAIIADPVRPGVREAIGLLGSAGIKTYLLTGDHPATARTVAIAVGLPGDVATGSELDKMGDGQLSSTLKKARVFARLSPAQKLRLVEVARAAGEEVAYVGDGINDAAAIQAADVGLAMGKIGTDLAKETADLVLTDDSYVHLSDAVQIGRTALENFRKGLTYYLSAKAILLSIFLVPLALGIPFPLAPIHIILVELLMDLASSTIFVTEPPEPDVMRRPPPKTSRLIHVSLARQIAVNGAGLATGILAIYLWLYYTTGDLVLAQTAAFVAWLLGHVSLALNLKQEKLPLLRQGLLANRFGALWLGGMILLATVISNLPAMFPILQTTWLSLADMVIIDVVVILSTCWIEVKKWLSLLS